MTKPNGTEEELRLKLDDSEIMHDPIIISLRKSEVKTLYEWLMREHLPPDGDIIEVVMKIQAAYYSSDLTRGALKEKNEIKPT